MEQGGRKIRGRGSGVRGFFSEDAGWPMLLLRSLLFSYIFTAVLLVVLAFLLYQFGLTEKPVAIAIIVIYVAATFLAGFLVGKRLRNRKFLWGLLAGVAYFVILLLVSLIADGSPDALGNSFFTTLVLCACGGMMGGMLS